MGLDQNSYKASTWVLLYAQDLVNYKVDPCTLSHPLDITLAYNSNIWNKKSYKLTF